MDELSNNCQEACMEGTFYMVQGSGIATVRHGSREAADTEARRLARNNAGQKFYVMMAVGGYVKDDVREIKVTHPLSSDFDDERPF